MIVVFLTFVRYGIPILLFVAGVVVLFAAEESIRLDVWAMLWGAAFALVVLNLLFRFGFHGDKDRQDEEDARRFLMEHGHWPDEQPRNR